MSKLSNLTYFWEVKILRAIYTGYAFVIFSVLFLLVFPFLMIPIIDKRRYNWIGVVNRIWAWCIFTLMFIPVRIRYEEKFDQKKKYVICPNHFSYLDIPSNGLLKINAIFVGKSQLENIPLFGWMFKKLHITVNRESLKSRYATFIKAQEAIDEGKNLVIYPEGGIISENPPEMTRFKDGAFRVAIGAQIPIVPVTIVNNWIILPSNFLLKWSVMRMVVHKPISTEGMTEKDIPELKEKVAEPIRECLKRYHGN